MGKKKRKKDKKFKIAKIEFTGVAISGTIFVHPDELKKIKSKI